jgi:DNA-binding response OmpR family regulator
MRLTDQALGAVEFGRFRLLPRRRELCADGVAVELGSRAFDILMVLIEARGALVTKDEILARVWPDTVVEENNLVVQISTLRKGISTEPGPRSRLELPRCFNANNQRFGGVPIGADRDPPVQRILDVESRW